MYQHGKKPKRKSNPKVLLHASILLGASLVVAAYILHKDLQTGGPNEKTSVPIVTEVKGTETNTMPVNEPLFTFEIPNDWRQTNRVQNHAANYYEWRSSGSSDNRMLRLHIDVMPKSYKVVRLQPLYPSGAKFNLGKISDNCENFSNGVGGQQSQGGSPALSKWENISFICDPITNNQTIGTGSVEDGIAAKLSGSSGVHSFFFYYEDHNIRPDDSIFQNILRSFQVK